MPVNSITLCVLVIQAVLMFLFREMWTTLWIQILGSLLEFRSPHNPAPTLEC